MSEAGARAGAEAQEQAETCSVPVYAEHVDRLSQELIGNIADKWTLIVFEELAENGTMRFTDLRKAIPAVSQKMLTQTLRQMERIGLVTRTVHPVVPPRVEYRRTVLAQTLGPVICQLWSWVERNSDAMDRARKSFDQAHEQGGKSS